MRAKILTRAGKELAKRLQRASNKKIRNELHPNVGAKGSNRHAHTASLRTNISSLLNSDQQKYPSLLISHQEKEACERQFHQQTPGSESGRSMCERCARASFPDFFFSSCFVLSRHCRICCWSEIGTCNAFVKSTCCSCVYFISCRGKVVLWKKMRGRGRQEQEKR